MKLLNFGSLNLDYVYKVKQFVRPGETVAAYEMNIFPGGKGLNQSIAMARAGGEVCHVGVAGEDGQMLLNLLRDNKVDTQYITQIAQKQGHALIQVNCDGENCIIIYGGSNQCLMKDPIDEVLNKFTKDTIVVVQNEVSNVDYIVEQAYQKGMKVIFNPSPVNECLKQVDLSQVSWILVNEVELMALSGAKDEETALDILTDAYPDLGVVFTRGSKGGICLIQGKRCSYESFQATVVDTTAAGDTFAGYFAAGIARGEKLETILTSAAAAAAMAVTREGAAPSIPHRDEVLCRIEQM